MIVVSDSTILIGLVKIRKLHLLREIFSKIFVPEEVFKEVVERGKGKPGSKVIKEAAWIEVKPVKDKCVPLDILFPFWTSRTVFQSSEGS